MWKNKIIFQHVITATVHLDSWSWSNTWLFIIASLSARFDIKMDSKSTDEWLWCQYQTFEKWCTWCEWIGNDQCNRFSEKIQVRSKPFKDRSIVCRLVSIGIMLYRSIYHRLFIFIAISMVCEKAVLWFVLKRDSCFSCSRWWSNCFRWSWWCAISTISYQRQRWTSISISHLPRNWSCTVCSAWSSVGLQKRRRSVGWKRMIFDRIFLHRKSFTKTTSKNRTSTACDLVKHQWWRYKWTKQYWRY